MIFTENIASILVIFSLIGLVIFFGTILIVPMVYELVIFRRGEKLALILIHHFRYRLIIRIAQIWSIIYLLNLSFVFIVIGLLSLLYLVTNNDSILLIAIYLSIISLLLTIIYIVFITLSSFSYSREETKQILDYFPSDID